MDGFIEAPHNGQAAWKHKTKPVWVTQYDAIEGVRAVFFQAYTAVDTVPRGREPWTVDNVRLGPLKGFPDLEQALRAAVA